MKNKESISVNFNFTDAVIGCISVIGAAFLLKYLILTEVLIFKPIVLGLLNWVLSVLIIFTGYLLAGVLAALLLTVLVLSTAFIGSLFIAVFKLLFSNKKQST